MEPETAKQIGRELSDVGRMLSGYINAHAPSAPPMRGWRTTPVSSPQRQSRGGKGWDADVTWSPIRARSSRRGTTVTVSTVSANVAAIIYESAGVQGGRKARGKPGSGDGGLFIQNLEDDNPLVQSGRYQGRLGRAAIKANYGQVLRDIEAACERAVYEVNRRMP